MQNWKKILEKLCNSFEISKIYLEFSGHALVGQNDFLDVLLLGEFFLDINCYALSTLFADFCNLSPPAHGVESLKLCCCCSMKSFILYGEVNGITGSRKIILDIKRWNYSEKCLFLPLKLRVEIACRVLFSDSPNIEILDKVPLRSCSMFLAEQKNI